MDCIFCKIITKQAPAHILRETEDLLCFLDINPVSKGHLLIIPKKHYLDVCETPEDELKRMIIMAKDMGKLVKGRLKADGFNILNACGRAAQQSVFHTHFHVVPRYENDPFSLWFRPAPGIIDQDEILEILKGGV